MSLFTPLSSHVKEKEKKMKLHNSFEQVGKKRCLGGCMNFASEPVVYLLCSQGRCVCNFPLHHVNKI